MTVVDPPWVSSRDCTIVDLAVDIKEQACIVDAHLCGAARWRGEIRREQLGRPEDGERVRVAAAFDALVVASPEDREISSTTLRWLHRSIGGTGSFRTHDVVVGTWEAPPAAQIEALVAEVLTRAATSTEEAPVATARLHLQLLRVHPFDDGNGRAVRLVAASSLLGAGYRSTLFTAAEQHFRADPLAYGAAFAALSTNRSNENEWVRTAMWHMRSVSAAVSWWCRRRTYLEDVLAGAGIEGAEVGRAMSSFDLAGRTDSTATRALAAAATPWRTLRSGLPDAEASESGVQLRRVREEERDDHIRRQMPGRTSRQRDRLNDTNCGFCVLGAGQCLQPAVTVEGRTRNRALTHSTPWRQSSRRRSTRSARSRFGPALRSSPRESWFATVAPTP